MKIIHLDAAAIAAGETAFDAYSRALTVGPLSPCYEEGLQRQTGIEVIAGAISKAIKLNYDHDQIVNAVSRVGRCKRSTVEDIFHALTGGSPEKHLWGYLNDGYVNWSDVEAARPSMVLVA